MMHFFNLSNFIYIRLVMIFAYLLYSLSWYNHIVQAGPYVLTYVSVCDSKECQQKMNKDLLDLEQNSQKYFDRFNDCILQIFIKSRQTVKDECKVLFDYKKLMDHSSFSLALEGHCIKGK